MDIKNNKWLEKLSNNGSKKNFTNLGIIFLVGVLVLLCFDFFNPSSAATSNNAASQKPLTAEEAKIKQDFEKQVTDQLKDTLESVEGVGKVKVMIYFDGGEEQVPAMNINDATNTTEESDTEGGKRQQTQTNDGRTVVVTNDGSKSSPLILKTYKPKVTGVCVVAEGADSKTVQLMVKQAVVNTFGISNDKVTVYPMQK